MQPPGPRSPRVKIPPKWRSGPRRKNTPVQRNLEGFSEKIWLISRPAAVDNYKMCGVFFPRGGLGPWPLCGKIFPERCFPPISPTGQFRAHGEHLPRTVEGPAQTLGEIYPEHDRPNRVMNYPQKIGNPLRMLWAWLNTSLAVALEPSARQALGSRLKKISPPRNHRQPEPCLAG
jgi:hypothetical protein